MWNEGWNCSDKLARHKARPHPWFSPSLWNSRHRRRRFRHQSMYQRISFFTYIFSWFCVLCVQLVYYWVSCINVENALSTSFHLWVLRQWMFRFACVEIKKLNFELSEIYFLLNDYGFYNLNICKLLLEAFFPLVMSAVCSVNCYLASWVNVAPSTWFVYGLCSNEMFRFASVVNKEAQFRSGGRNSFWNPLGVS